MDKKNILETIKMLDEENLDVRTLTMGISLFDCIDTDYRKACDKIYDKHQRKFLESMVFQSLIIGFLLPL